jgi:ABC-type transporter Mla MlaB component
MPYELERFGGPGKVSGFRIRLLGRFCFREGLAIWEQCHPDRLRSQLYYIDLAETSDIPEDAVAWLAMFLRWAEESGVSVRLTNAKPEHADWLSAVGICEAGTALDPANPASLRGAFVADLDASISDIGDVTLEQVAIASHHHGDNALDGGAAAAAGD